ncbi:uncharacterized protein F54H12.2-like [Pseudophryne corroboree]|uniref:uncharacterized protein F54H12.2-like n=1 Tax=Pseudophryne corroboree TaxID=495146 RepID=UPI003081721C
MSFIHNEFMECAKSELDIFDVPLTQTSIEKSLYVKVQPLVALYETAPLEFYIAASGEHYYDLNNTLLYVTCKIVRSNNNLILQGARAALINYPIATLFNQVDVSLGDRLISQSNNLYAYKAYIETTLNYSSDSLYTKHTTGLFYKYVAGEHNTRALDGLNTGFIKRARGMAQIQTVELLGPLYCDLFHQHKLILNAVDLKIKLTRNKDSFCLMSVEPDPFNIQIVTAYLFVKRVQVSPAAQIGHAQALLNGNAKYAIDHVGMKINSIPAGSTVFHLENLFLGQEPKTVIAVFVDNEVFSEAYDRKPLCFEHKNVNFASLYPDGTLHPANPFQPDFEHGNADRKYMSLIQITNKQKSDSGILIDREEYLDGYTLFAFDLSPEQEIADHILLGMGRWVDST